MLAYAVDIKGLDKLESNMDRAPQTYRREVSAAINKSLVDLQRTAKTLSPVDTGRLRASILVEPARVQGDVIKGSVGTLTRYAGFQEEGTSRGVPARYYMRGSIEQNQAGIDRYFEQAASNLAEAIAGGRAA